jgi:hypothetical protein
MLEGQRFKRGIFQVACEDNSLGVDRYLYKVTEDGNFIEPSVSELQVIS